MNLAIMVCIDCSGCHRGLGSHVSKVRSLTLDSWSPTSLRLLAEIGNERANKIFEGENQEIIQQFKQGAEAPQPLREEFITQKYVQKALLRPLVPPSSATQWMHTSARDGDLMALYTALVQGGNVNEATSTDGNLRTALHLAAMGNHVLCVELLCIWNSPLEDVDSFGKTAMDLARERHFDEIVEILVSYGAKGPV
jgi:hypothetical protein